MYQNEVWVEVEIDGQIIEPRERMVSVAYARFANRLPANSVTADIIAQNGVASWNIAPDAVRVASIQNGAVTSNKIDWTTMPAVPAPLLGYAENGDFATPPVASGYDAIALGLENTASGDYSAVGGGMENTVSGDLSVIGGGYHNVIEDEAGAAVIGGGYGNSIDEYSSSATVGGGTGNAIGAFSYESTVGGGRENRIGPNVRYGTIAGGRENHLDDFARSAAIGGGRDNTIESNSYYATISGGHRNLIRVGATNAVIVGGYSNRVSGIFSVIGGGRMNVIETTGTNAVIAGGYSNLTSGRFSSVGGGGRNTASGWSATVGGGWNNTASGFISTVGGGDSNTASGAYASIGGGAYNTADGDEATIPGGSHNNATDYAFAAGRRAKAIHTGSFVWGDSTDADIASTNNNSVTFRCNGGVRFTSGTAGGNQTVAWAPGAGSWSFTSDRTTKEGFVPVDSRAVLEKVVALPLTEWNYVGYEQRHIGPMAQDFHAAFPLAGSSDTAINSLHLDGVALAAIQGLYSEVTRLRLEATAWHGGQQSEVSRLQKENADLKARLERLEALLGARAQ